MWRLVKYLEENWPAIEAKGDYDGLAEKLAEIWPSEGAVAKDHKELAAAVAAALRLGRRAQEIKEAGDREAGKFFRESMLMAFEAGRRSAITSP
ncbi:MAG: hypothetical protein ABI347_06280 [Nitrososphaera sp.]|jgi:hypothetical protein